MGAFLAYTVYSGIFLLAGYLLYKWIMASEKQSSLNRGVLIGIYVLSFAAQPLSRIRFGATESSISALEFGNLEFVSVAGTSVPLWPRVLLMIYLAGLAAVLIWTLVVAVRLAVLINSGSRVRYQDYTLVLLSRPDVAPFSWSRYIVMSEADYASAGELITAHEAAHIHYRHCYDLLAAQLVCIIMWYNPAAWLMREELKSVHEYQADGAVITSGVDARRYQMLLIKKAVGIRFQSLANSLNHSKLKQRITMMYKEQNRGLRRLRGLVLGLAPVMALAVVNIPAVASAITNLGEASIEGSAKSMAPVTVDKVSENPANTEGSLLAGKVDAVEKLATYPGGEKEMFRYLALNVKYPAAAMEKNIQGRSVIGFPVEADGSLSGFKVVKSAGALLDQEATRVIASMPKWDPAMKDGVAVASQYVLPVDFKLMGGEEESVESVSADAKVLDDIKVVGYGTMKKSADSLQTNSITIKMRDKSNSTTVKGEPAVFVDGKKISSDALKDISPETIESISVRKDIPEYPNGAIYVILKK